MFSKEIQYPRHSLDYTYSKRCSEQIKKMCKNWPFSFIRESCQEIKRKKHHLKTFKSLAQGSSCRGSKGRKFHLKTRGFVSHFGGHPNKEIWFLDKWSAFPCQPVHFPLFCENCLQLEISTSAMAMMMTMDFASAHIKHTWDYDLRFQQHPCLH